MSPSLNETKKTKVVVLGANGQLGTALQNLAPEGQVDLYPFSSAQLDVTNRDQLISGLASCSPDALINASAYTAVDKAETDQENARAVNVVGAENIAEALKGTQCRVYHISTDFVFDGKKSSPYLPEDPTSPLGVYGQTKLEGEQALLRMIPDQSTIIRTAWLYSATHPCFLATMLRLMKERDNLGVIADQVGTPTSVNSLANVIWQLVFKNDSQGIYHWSDAGVASWYDFTVAIYEFALDFGVLDKAVEITPLQTSQYPTPAQRPSYSVMDKTALYELLDFKPVHWREELKKVLRTKVL